MAKILMVGSEAAPFASTGGLADVLGALPKALVEAGEEVAVTLPGYRAAAIPEARTIYERLQFPVGPHAYSADIAESVQDGVRYLFVQIPGLYEGDGLYGESGGDYPDNHLRFGALCQAALRITHYIFAPQILHCHDWQAGLVPVLLKHVYSGHPSYLDIKTVFTIHNLPYQGLFPREALADLGLPDTLFRPEILELKGGISFLKAALTTSDVLNTVSPQYAKDIQTPEYGFGLDSVLRARSKDLSGILNGADYRSWDPATDTAIAQQYDRDHLGGKQVCKRALLEELGLPAARLERPLIAIISRFAWQKGLDLLTTIPHELAREDVSLVVLGSGEQPLEDFFRWFAAAYPDRVAVRIGYEDELAHRVQAGADMFLMPSRYEPCGLNQLHSLRYGTLPLVRATGGLEDTVDGNTGFKFWGANSHDLLECIRAALRVYGTPRWREMMRAAMQRSFSWSASAAEYSKLYRVVLAGSERPLNQNSQNDHQDIGERLKWQATTR
ncbi:MAG TPA: glycogen synthase GlgA [Bryobacteraceae bacterium]|nr:glycogen synthase GlgA [Bryobacteraceae bacterium]